MMRRWFWPSFALPGVAWLVLLFLVPTYAVVAVAFGSRRPDLSLNPVPAWNPLDWRSRRCSRCFADLKPGHTFWIVFVRTFEYVAISLAGCLLIGYPVAYYLARYARRTRGILLVLLVVPFWVSYLMRMLAWVGLLLPDGLVNRTLIHLGIISHPYAWLDGQPSSVMFASSTATSRTDPAALRGARPDRPERARGRPRPRRRARSRTFFHVTLPLSRNGILAASVLITLPMFGDYYTNDVISDSPQTSMIGNQINLFFQGGAAGEHRRVSRDRALAAARRADVVLPLGHGARVGGDEGVAAVSAVSRVRDWFANPWGQPRLLGTFTWALHGLVDRAGAGSRFSSRSTTGDRAASGRGSRRAGGGAIRTTRCSTIRRCEGASSRASGSPGSTC